MTWLDAKIPPPVVALALAGVMWWVAPMPVAGVFPFEAPTAVVLAVAALGLGIEGAGIASFLRARTNPDPMHPGSATALVVSGVYRFTRNPMYVGDVLLLAAWALRSSSLAAFAGPVLFVLYIDRFQIRAEERALAELFGKRYDDYRSRVRRWV